LTWSWVICGSSPAILAVERGAVVGGGDLVIQTPVGALPFR